MKLNNAINKRWSPIAFTEQPVTEEMINLLFEAARKAPSSRNEQPWNYYYVHRSNEKVFNDFLGLMTGNNPFWAKEAQVLIVSVMKKNFDHKNRPNGKALHDIGAANISIGIQAAEMGLQAHPLGGFDKAKAAEYLRLDNENYEPVIMIAAGFPDQNRPETEQMQNRKKESDTRKPVSEFAFNMGRIT